VAAGGPALAAAAGGGGGGATRAAPGPAAPPVAPPSVPAYRVLTEGRVGSVSGTVRWRGELPPGAEVTVRSHVETCGATRQVSSVRIGTQSGVIGAVITLEGIREGRLPLGGEARFAFAGCELTPAVVATSVGARLLFTNEEDLLHNVRIATGTETWLDVGLPQRGSTAEATARRGVHRITDDAAHPWIESWLVVAEHPYVVVTDVEGRFHLPRVPVGSYQIRLWHPGILTGGPSSSGRPERSAPIVLSRPLSVSEANDTTTDFELDATSVEAAGALRP